MRMRGTVNFTRTYMDLLNPGAVIAVEPFEPCVDGTFELPGRLMNAEFWLKSRHGHGPVQWRAKTEVSAAAK